VNPLAAPCPIPGAINGLSAVVCNDVGCAAVPVGLGGAACGYRSWF
jgi:hypothetical protein